MADTGDRLHFPLLRGSVVVDKVVPKVYAVLVSRSLQSGWLVVHTEKVCVDQKGGTLWIWCKRNDRLCVLWGIQESFMEVAHTVLEQGLEG